MGQRWQLPHSMASWTSAVEEELEEPELDRDLDRRRSSHCCSPVGGRPPCGDLEAVLTLEDFSFLPVSFPCAGLCGLSSSLLFFLFFFDLSDDEDEEDDAARDFVFGFFFCFEAEEELRKLALLFLLPRLLSAATWEAFLALFLGDRDELDTSQA